MLIAAGVCLRARRCKVAVTDSWKFETIPSLEPLSVQRKIGLFFLQLKVCLAGLLGRPASIMNRTGLFLKIIAAGFLTFENQRALTFRKVQTCQPPLSPMAQLPVNFLNCGRHWRSWQELLSLNSVATEPNRRTPSILGNEIAPAGRVLCDRLNLVWLVLRGQGLRELRECVA